jgi:hypothetical protein
MAIKQQGNNTFIVTKRVTINGNNGNLFTEDLGNFMVLV